MSSRATALRINVKLVADLLLPKRWMSNKPDNHKFGFSVIYEELEAPKDRFLSRFPNARPRKQESITDEEFYAVSDLVEESRDLLGSGVDVLKAQLQQREAQSSTSLKTGEVVEIE